MQFRQIAIVFLSLSMVTMFITSALPTNDGSTPMPVDVRGTVTF